jgi:hypothetical protein
MALTVACGSRARVHAGAALAVLLGACVPAGAVLADAATCTGLDDLTWLVGAWRAESGDSVITETWAAVSRDTFEGRGVTRARADGAQRDSEDLRLLAMGDGVFYVAKVAHNAQPVGFRLTACSGDRYVFENAAHDFPRRIEYRRRGEDRLDVQVSDGAERGFLLEFSRSPGG